MRQALAYWSRNGLLLLGFIGIVIIADVGVRFPGAWIASDRLRCLSLGSIALMVVGVWALALMHTRNLDRLAGRTEERVIRRLSNSAYLIAVLSYLMLLEALH